MFEQPKEMSVTSPPPLSPTQNISHIALSFNVSEFLIVAGHSRAQMTPVAGGMAAQMIQEWLLSLSMSPTTACILFEALKSGIKQYEEQFDKIPQEKNSSIAP